MNSCRMPIVFTSCTLNVRSVRDANFKNRSTVDISFLQDGILLLLETASSPVALKCEKNVLDYGSQRRKV